MAYVYWIHDETHCNLSEGYIGVSSDYKKRFREHKKRFGADVQYSVLLEADEAYCYSIEAQLRPSPNIGWNEAKGGMKPPNQLGNHWVRGPMPEETKQKIRERKLGKKLSNEHREKISTGVKRNPPAPSYRPRDPITGRFSQQRYS